MIIKLMDRLATSSTPTSLVSEPNLWDENMDQKLNRYNRQSDSVTEDYSKDDEKKEDGASCYLCTHCGKGYDSEFELDEHLRSVRLINSNIHTPPSDGQQQREDSAEMDDELYIDEFDQEDEEVFPEFIKRSSSEIAHSTPDETARKESPEMDAGHSNRRSYSCKFCSKMFDSNSALNVHYTHTHRDKPQYECDLCGRVYGVKRELATHRRSHEGQPTHRCRQCGKEFGTKQLLRKHELWHTGERSHVCPQCGKAFFQKGHLTQHMMIHAGGRPHACHLCQKTFIFKFDLNRHMKIHAERVGNAEESPDTNMDAKLAYDSNGADSNDPADTNDRNTPTDAQLFSMGNSTSLPLLQKLHQHNSSGQEVLGAGTVGNPFHGLLRTWTPSAPFLDTSTNGDHQRAALAAAFAQALCHAQQQASILAGFTSASSPQFVFDNQQQSQNQQMINNPNGVSEHDSTSGSSPATLDDHRESESPTLNAESMNRPSCESCLQYRQRTDVQEKRIRDLESDLAQRQREVDALNGKIQRVTDVASRLLESCSDFDKLWMLHSKQVYSQIQNILNVLD